MMCYHQSIHNKTSTPLWYNVIRDAPILLVLVHYYLSYGQLLTSTVANDCRHRRPGHTRLQQEHLLHIPVLFHLEIEPHAQWCQESDLGHITQLGSHLHHVLDL